MFVGVGASRVRDLFKEAKSDPAAIVFVDELTLLAAAAASAWAAVMTSVSRP